MSFWFSFILLLLRFVFSALCHERQDGQHNIEYAIESNDLLLLREILEQSPGAAYAALPASRRLGAHATTPLHLAVEQGNGLFAKVLLDYGAELDDTNEYGVNSLSWAVWLNVDVSLLNLLLDNASKRSSLLESRDNFGRTPLAIAVSNSNIELVRLLISRRAMTNTFDLSNCNPPILVNVRLESEMCNSQHPLNEIEMICPNLFIARALLNAGADVSVVDKCSGESAVQLARRANKSDMVALLDMPENNHVRNSSALLRALMPQSQNFSHMPYNSFTVFPNTQCSSRGYRVFGGVSMNDVNECVSACQDDPNCVGFNLMITASSGPTGNGCVTKTFGCTKRSDYQFAFYQKDDTKIEGDNDEHIKSRRKRSVRTKKQSAKRKRRSTEIAKSPNSYCFPGRYQSSPMNYAFMEHKGTRCGGGQSHLIDFRTDAAICAEICAENSDCVGYNVHTNSGTCEVLSYGCRQMAYSEFFFYERRNANDEMHVPHDEIAPGEQICVLISPPWIGYNQQTTILLSFSLSPCLSSNLYRSQNFGTNCSIDDYDCEEQRLLHSQGPYYDDIPLSLVKDPAGRWIKMLNATTSANGYYLVTCPLTNLEFEFQVQIGVEPRIVLIELTVTKSNKTPQLFTLRRYPSPYGRSFPDVHILPDESTIEKLMKYQAVAIKIDRDSIVNVTVITEIADDGQSDSLSNIFEMLLVSEVANAFNNQAMLEDITHQPSENHIKVVQASHQLNFDALIKDEICEISSLAIARLYHRHADRDIIMLRLAYDPVISHISVNTVLSGKDKCNCWFTCHVSACPSDLLEDLHYEWSFYNGSAVEHFTIDHQQGREIIVNMSYCQDMVRHQYARSSVSCTVHSASRVFSTKKEITFSELLSGSRHNEFFSGCGSYIYGTNMVESFVDIHEPASMPAPSASSSSNIDNIVGSPPNGETNTVEETVTDDGSPVVGISATVHYEDDGYQSCSCLLECNVGFSDVGCRFHYEWTFYDSSLIPKPANFRPGNVLSNPKALFLNNTVCSSMVQRFTEVIFLQQTFVVACRAKAVHNPFPVDKNNCNSAASTVHQQNMFTLLQQFYF